ncbi:MAG: hypothetical protein ACK4NO_05305 [Glycocaulis sp.]
MIDLEIGLGESAGDNRLAATENVQLSVLFRRAAARRIDAVADGRCPSGEAGGDCELIQFLRLRVERLAEAHRQNVRAAQFRLNLQSVNDQPDLLIGGQGMGGVAVGDGLTDASLIVRELDSFSLRDYLLGCPQTGECLFLGDNPPCNELCERRFVLASRLLPAALLLSLAAQRATESRVEAFTQHLNGLHDRWAAYHFGGGYRRTQLPWELAINGYFFEQQSRGEGFHEPPRGAIIFMRPAVGGEWDGDGNTARLAFVGELIGYSRWGYRANNTRGPEWGGALIASYNADARNRWGYGAHIRTPLEGVTVGAVHRRDDGWSVVVSSNLVGLFNERKRLAETLCDRFSVGPVCDLRSRQ